VSVLGKDGTFWFKPAMDREIVRERSGRMVKKERTLIKGKEGKKVQIREEGQKKVFPFA